MIILVNCCRQFMYEEQVYLSFSSVFSFLMHTQLASAPFTFPSDITLFLTVSGFEMFAFCIYKLWCQYLYISNYREAQFGTSSEKFGCWTATVNYYNLLMQIGDKCDVHVWEVGGVQGLVNVVVGPLFHQSASVSVLLSPIVTTGICELSPFLFWD